MSCFFCSSDLHVTHDCDIYNSDDDRRKLLASKNCCQSCLTQHDFHRISCQQCGRYQQCYICFSKTHHTVFCPDRFTAPKICLPNIDRDLLPRFMEMLSMEDKYSLFLSSTGHEFIKLMPFKIKCVKEIQITRFTLFSETDILVAEKAILGYGIEELLLSQKIAFRIQHLELRNYSSCTIPNFLQFLSSSKPKSLTCRGTQFHPTYLTYRRKFTISDIFKSAPNLENCEMRGTDIEVTKSWPDDLLQCATKLKRLSLSIPDLNFNVKSLAALMKEKSVTTDLFLPVCRNVILSLLFPGSIKKERLIKKNDIEEVTKKLKKYFTPSILGYDPFDGLFVHIHDDFGYGPKQYVLKKV